MERELKSLTGLAYKALEKEGLTQEEIRNLPIEKFGSEAIQAMIKHWAEGNYHENYIG